jgi:F0F1-type ATP synthase assembly protein I
MESVSMAEVDPEPDSSQASDSPGSVPQSPKEQQAESMQWHRMAGIGFEFISAVGLFGLVGYGLDRWLGTKPWLLLVGVGLGFAAGLWQMIRTANRMFR